jgi:hypothetical protein
MFRPARSLLVIVTAVTIARSATATPGVSLIEQCAADSENGQRHQRTSTLRAAREDFRRCARSECPDAISTFCVGRLSDVLSAIPTLVVRARLPDGTDDATLDVGVDGVVSGKSDGRAMEVDPGPHTIHLQRHDTGSAVVRTTIVVAEGERARPIVLAIPAPLSTSSVPPPAGAPVSRPAEAPTRASPPVVGLGVIGVVGIVVGAGFWAAAVSARSDELEVNGCAPRCSDAVKDSIRTRVLIGDGLFLTGAISLGVAAYLFLRSSPVAR